MKKLLVILILVISFYLATNFILSTLLPEKINQAAKEFVEDNFGRKIIISHINVNIIRGIFLKDITIFEADRKTPYLKIKIARVTPFYPSLLNSKKLSLSINLEGVYFTLKRNADNTFNLLQIQPAPQLEVETAKKSVKATKNIFLIKSLSLKKLNLDFVDTTVGFKKKFEGITVFADLQAFPKITSKILWQEKLKINAKYNSSSRELKGSAQLKEIALNDFNSYFPQIILKDGYIKNAKINIEGKENYTLKIDALLSELSLTKEKAEIKGNLHTAMQINTGAGNVIYNISGSLNGGNLKLLPYLDSLTSAKGNFQLDNKKLQLTDLTADFSTFGKEKDKDIQTKIPIVANAEVNFETSQVTVKAKATPQITDLLKAVKTINADNSKALKNFNYEGGGNIILVADIKTNLKNEYFEYYIDYYIENVDYKEFKNIRANGFIANDKFKIENCKFKHKNIAWDGVFELNDFSSPDMKLVANSSLFNLNLTAKQLKDLTAIKNLTIKTKNSQVKAEGGYHRDTQELELQGLAYIELSEIMPLADTYNIKVSGLKKAGPRGVLNAKFMINGPLKPDKWQIKLAGLSEKLKIYNLEASEVKLELYRDKDLLIISPLVADIAQGKIDLRIKTDSINKKMVVNMLINDLDLAVLREQLKLKNSFLSGILSLDANFENNSLTSLTGLEGSGKVSIHNGNIWEINFLKGMGEFLFIPEFEQIKFEEGYSDLIFKGENVVFENIELNSYQMNLKGKGRISLKGDLNFILVSEFNPDLVSSSQGLKKFFTNLLGQTSLAIELKGTVKNPTYNVKPVIFSDLEGFKKILDGIFK
ncbi:MAG: hypothetical protein M0R48_06145 [Candidatus Omnitrophica bacterium]|jgi:hypothetical protein|nr:hypothetical protein [Candidatus Omnitrophota bacterium]